MSMLIGTRRALLGGIPKFSPLDISGLQLWLKADAGLYTDAAMTTPAVNDNDVVGGWADQSGNSNHATQATTARKPLLKLAIVNGKPVVRFDTTDDLLGHNILDLDPYTYFMVWSKSGVANRFVLGKSSTAYPYLQYGVNWYVGDAGQVVAMTTNQVYIKTAVVNATTIFRFTDGSASASQARSTKDVGFGYLGLSPFILGGDVAELLIYNTALSAADRQAVEAYLNNRYAVY